MLYSISQILLGWCCQVSGLEWRVCGRLKEPSNYRPVCLAVAKEWRPKVAAVQLFAEHLCLRLGPNCACCETCTKGTGGVHLILARRSLSESPWPSHFSFIYFSISLVPHPAKPWFLCLFNPGDEKGISFGWQTIRPSLTWAIPKI